ncbi:AzlC family ABC transporter permease [Palleronia sp. KMU-117]|uniref:AzlC family ABC transporter permease n=1 Tax=Palleronia sp. KMU-117 TaxID=3434108 RepID=UPI003D7254F8
MSSSSPRSAFWRGFRDAAPFIVVVAPFGLVFGVVATEAGLTLGQSMGFSVLVIAGASQLTAIQLMTENAPTLVVIATALAVNLRMAMYSASLAPHLGGAPFWKRGLIAYLNVDQTYAVAIGTYERAPGMTLPEKVAYFFGTATPTVPFWYGMSLAGAMFGARIPPEFALDFAVPITFLAVVAPMMRTLAHVAAAFTSVVMALALSWVPAGLGLLIAGVLAMMVGARVELAMERRA